MTQWISRSRERTFVFVALLLLGYALPWLVTPVASLTFGAYDLAEWTSLVPSVRNGNPPLLTTLMLRFPLAGMALLAAFGSGGSRTVATAKRSGVSRKETFQRDATGWLASGVVVILAIAQLPPLEFFTVARGDPNYGQQLTLVVFTVIAGCVGLFLPSHRLDHWVTLALIFVTAISSVVGVTQALAFMRDFGVEANAGPGAILFVGLLVGWGIMEALPVGHKKKE